MNTFLTFIKMYDNISRRSILQGATASALAGLTVSNIETVSAIEGGDYHVGETQFVEVQIKYETDVTPDTHREGSTSHILDRNNDILTLGRTPSNIFRNEDLVNSYRRKYYPKSQELAGDSRPAMAVESSFSGREERSIFVKSEYREPSSQLSPARAER